jgi:predicted  nucleic acid-binding Zn-ribbon protein
VNEDLRRLVRLQELMQAAEQIEEKIAAVPTEVARLEKDLLAVEREVEQERARIGDLQKERRKLEMELMGIETKISKYQSQLLDVKTNKEYQTMLHEIETCRAERAALDERILLDMEEGERHQAAVRMLEDRLRERRRATEDGKKRLDGTLHALRDDKTRLEEERKGLAATVSAPYLEPFMKVARQRGGIALVAVREELCGGCHVRVMPKLIQQVRRATGLIACDSCKRFLYFPEDVVPPDASAAGASPS